MSPYARPRGATAMRFPRVSGDEPGLLDLWAQIYLFSPRERG